ncbi:MAG: hypothetical protein HXY43_09330 [Fischerella sp.]|jgi:hypothetical protein|uniref:hypothetical protein n=1 Tax=Fischerella sp. TaxID=1191 RepID=UPI0017B34060|nr:hypothetical protein [Fischerella sp.]NWF59488.1 hypothetical protein [Fischerella sp.]
MKVDFGRLDFAIQAKRQDLDLKTKQQHFQIASWVRLLELPNPYSFDEALLLCPISENEWVAWIPDHGEALLHTRQFRKI